MQSEWKHIVNEFNKAYYKYRKCNIALYGIGKHTKSVLDQLGHDYNFIGLMDAENEGKTIWAYKILSLEEAKERQVDFIVIIARPSVHQTIYRRIAHFTEENGIPVYDYQMKKLYLKQDEAETDNPYFRISKAELVKAIDMVDVVSFDIFDTLVMRKVLYPNDVFYIMDKELGDKYRFIFSESRINAIQSLKKTKNPTIDEIYEFIQKKHSLSIAERESLKRMEIEKEIELIIPRNEMVELFKYCVQSDKIVYLVSDMYLTEKILNKIMKQNGICGYKKLIVSCEYGMSKKEGLLEVLLVEQANKSILHIGDDDEKDIKPAKRVGYDSFRILSAYDLLCVSTYSTLNDHTINLLQRNILGLFISKAFNNPFTLYNTKGRRAIRTAEDIGLILAPFTMFLLHWILYNIYRNNVSDVLFVSRDGYLPRKLYEQLLQIYHMKDIPKGKYIYMSGRATSVAAIENKDDILRFLGEYRGSPDQMFDEVLLIEKPEFAAKETCANVVKKHDKYIIDNIKDEKEAYKRYIEEVSIDQHRTILYFDLFSKGTGQLNLKNLSNIDCLGCYLHRGYSDSKDKNALDTLSLYDGINRYDKDYYAFQYYSLLEYIFSSPEACFCKFDNHGELIFYKEDRSSEGINFMLTVQDKIMEFCLECAKMLPHYSEYNYSSKMTEAYLALLSGKKSDSYCDILDRLMTYEWARAAYKKVGKL